MGETQLTLYMMSWLAFAAASGSEVGIAML
jgi:hypothetical protein